ncbi:MAG: endonuclease/exonuclease/phosphatase family protein [Alphaproteobacteria bacterium]|nr:endonuclease/exonuclease/phosphatase family protein [Alphaproteobacteria bacterium]
MEKRRTWIREFLNNPVTFVTPFFTVLVLAASMPAHFQMADLASHFMAQYAVGAVVLFAMGILFRSSRYVLALLALLFCVSASYLLPYLPVTKPAPEGETMKIMQVNVLFINKNPALLKSLIEKEQPDIVVSSETPPVFADMFETLKNDYPWQDLHPQKGNPRGLGVISKRKLVHPERIHFDHKGVPSQVFTVDLGGQDVTFVSIHPFTPTENIERRDNEFRLIAARYKKEPVKNLVILGDFNATPYCAAYKQLVNALGLANARDGFGVYPSWPTFLPTPFLRIPIDHVLVSSTIAVHNFGTATQIGSDHLPTVTEISIKAKS